METLQNKILRDENGTAYAPVTTPNSVIWPNGDTLTDVIAEIESGSSIDISDKADKVTGATNGHLAGLDSTGNLTDSGKSPSDYISKMSNVSAGYLVVSASGGQVTTSSYTPASLISSALSSATSSANSALTGYSSDQISSTLTLNSLKNYINSEVQRLEALIAAAGGGGGKLIWRCNNNTSYYMNGNAYVLVDENGKAIVISSNDGYNYVLYVESYNIGGSNPLVNASSSGINDFSNAWGSVNVQGTISSGIMTFSYGGTTYTHNNGYISPAISADSNNIYQSS